LRALTSSLSLDIINAKALVRDKQNRDISLGAGAMLHDLAFREPDEAAGAKRPLVRHQVALQDIQAMAAGVGMGGVHQSRRVANEPDLGAGLRVRIQILAEDRLAELFVETLLP
jgi:hypothetical protein